MNKFIPVGIAVLALGLGAATVLAASTSAANHVSVTTKPSVASTGDEGQKGEADQANQTGDQGQKGEADQTGQTGDQGQKGEADQAGQTGDQGLKGQADQPATTAPTV